MQGIKGIEVERHQADGGKGGCNLAGHDAALPHAGDHELRFAVGTTLQELKRSLHLFIAQA